jgi:hypothetical protein
MCPLPKFLKYFKMKKIALIIIKIKNIICLKINKNDPRRLTRKFVRKLPAPPLYGTKTLAKSVSEKLTFV